MNQALSLCITTIFVSISIVGCGGATAIPAEEEFYRTAKKEANNWSKQEQLKVILDEKNKYFKSYHRVIEYIKNPDKEVQLAAVMQDGTGTALQYIKNPDREVQLAAVKQHSRALLFIENPDKEMQLIAVKNYGQHLKHIKNPDKEVQLAAVKQDGMAIQFIKNPDREIILEAVRKNGEYIGYSKNPDKELQLMAINQNINSIKYIQNPDKEVQLAAVKQNGMLIQHIQNPHKEVQLIAIKQNGLLIQHIRNPDKEVQIAAIEKEGFRVVERYIRDLDLILSEGGYKKISLYGTKYETSDDNIQIKISGVNVKIYNKTKNFIKVNSMAEYIQNDIFNIAPFTMAPESEKTLNVTKFSGYEIGIMHVDDKIQFGFALEYQLPNSIKTFNIYDVKSYSAKEIWNMKYNQ